MAERYVPDYGLLQFDAARMWHVLSNLITHGKVEETIGYYAQYCNSIVDGTRWIIHADQWSPALAIDRSLDMICGYRMVYGKFPTYSETKVRLICPDLRMIDDNSYLKEDGRIRVHCAVGTQLTYVCVCKKMKRVCVSLIWKLPSGMLCQRRSPMVRVPRKMIANWRISRTKQPGILSRIYKSCSLQ